MAVIKQVKLENSGVTTTHDIKDVASGYGSFSATQVMASGATTSLVATIKSRAMNTSTKQFGATTTVNFYSTGGSSSGNEWLASVSGTNLILSSSGSSSQMIMPTLASNATGIQIAQTLALEGILTASSGSGDFLSYTVNCGTLRIGTQTNGMKITYPYVYSYGDTIDPTEPSAWTATPSGYARLGLTQTPSGNTEVFSDSVIAIVITFTTGSVM